MTCMPDEEYWRAAALTMKAERDAARAELAHIRDATKVGSMSWNFDQLGVAYERLEARLAEQMADRADLESVIEVQTGRLCTALAERDTARAELAKAVRDINTFVKALDEAEVRLAAVIALCDGAPLRSMVISKFRVRAAAEGTDRD